MIGALVAAHGVIELQKLLALGEGPRPEHTLVGRELYLDARHHRQFLTPLRRNPACLFDHDVWSIESISELPLGRVLALGSAPALGRVKVESDRCTGEISLEGHVFVDEIVCGHCGYRNPTAVLRDRLESWRLRCTRCDSDQAVTTTAIDVSTWLGAAGLSAEMLRQPLRERGFRPGDVLTLRAGGRERHFEYAPHAEGASARGVGGRWHTVVIVGCGNIGSQLTAHVARLARGADLERVILVDPDTYSESNLAGQEIGCSDVGRPKVWAQAERMSAIYPELEVLPRVCRIEELPLAVLRGAILLGAVDSRDARQQINQAAWRIGSPWIDMAVDGPSLLCRVSTYLPGTGSVCLECSWSSSDYRLLGQVLPCDENRGSQDLEETEKEEIESPGVTVNGRPGRQGHGQDLRELDRE